MVELLVFVYHFYDTKKNVYGGDYNIEKDVEDLRKKLNYLAFGVIIHCTHATIFGMITWHI